MLLADGEKSVSMPKATIDKTMKKGFTFIELMVTVALLAGLMLMAIPKYTEAARRQNALRSGQNLKQINAAISQWNIDNSGPPNKTATKVVDISTLSAKPLFYLLPYDGSSTFCKNIGIYMPNASNPWVSPSRPRKTSYVYYAWITDTQPVTLYGMCFSLLDSTIKYEPSGYEKKSVPAANGLVYASYVNAYEDFGWWIPGFPRPQMYVSDPDGLVEDYNQ